MALLAQVEICSVQLTVLRWWPRGMCCCWLDPIWCCSAGRVCPKISGRMLSSCCISWHWNACPTAWWFHFSRDARAFCSCSWSSMEFMARYTRQSSAKSLHLVEGSNTIGRSFINSKNKGGPRTVPHVLLGPFAISSLKLSKLWPFDRVGALGDDSEFVISPGSNLYGDFTVIYIKVESDDPHQRDSSLLRWGRGVRRQSWKSSSYSEEFDFVCVEIDRCGMG